MIIPKILKTLLVIAGFTMSQASHAQLSSSTGLRISLLNEAVALPGYQLIKTPLHPGASVAMTFVWKEKAHSQWLINANLGGYYHKGLQSGIFIYPELAWKRRLGEHFYFQAGTGLGYLHSFYTQDVYRLNDEGVYEAIPKLGDAGILFTLNLGLGYSFNQFDLFAKYSAGVETPYANKWGMPVGPHTLYEAGIILFPFTKN